MPDYGGPGGFGGRGGGEAATGGVGGSGYGGRSRGQNQRGTNYSQSLARAINEANARARDRSLASRKARAALDAIQAAEAKQVSPTQSSVQNMVSRMDNERTGLMGLAADNQISNKQLNRLSELNEAIGMNRTTGMGPIESVRSTVSDPAFKSDLSRAMATYQKISPIGILASSIFGIPSPSLASLISKPASAMRFGQLVGSLAGRDSGVKEPTPGPVALPSGGFGGLLGKLPRAIIAPPSTGEMLTNPDQITEEMFAPGYGASLLNPGIRTAVFKDSDGDGVDDRDQVGPGMPKGVIPEDMQAGLTSADLQRLASILS
jgi:hypothetical protein